MTITGLQLGFASWRGAGLILRFNWPQYVAAAIVIAVTCVAIAATSASWAIKAAAALPVVAAAFWSLASLYVSHLVYDRSPAADWRNLRGLLPPPRRWVHLHAGLDNGTPHLRRLFPQSSGTVLDIYDEERMTEPSIKRARGVTPPAPRADYRNLPLPDGCVDAVFLLFAAHELRSHDDRVALFREVRRILAPGGGVVVMAEHLRDAWGWLAFGPGAMHFHSPAAWHRAADDADLEIDRELSCTRFARIFVMRRPR